VTIQENATVFEGEDPRKFEVGAKLLFVGAIDDVGPVPPVGRALEVVRTNRGGMGIEVRDCRREAWMVWPEEVRLA
jgi:hypothetical protein